MDSFEVDSEASLDSLRLLSEDFNIPSASPSPSTPDLTKKLQDLELENEKLRTALENSRIEIDSLKASNRALREKIGELFQEAQTSLETKLKLEDSLKERNCQLAVLENSSKWYQARLHESEAANRTLTADLEAYQKILTQREQNLADYVEKSEAAEKLQRRFDELQAKYAREQQNWQSKANFSKVQEKSEIPVNSSISEAQCGESAAELRTKIAEVERQLEIAEKRYLNVEVARNLAEKSSEKHRNQVEKLEENFERAEIEKNEMIEKLRILRTQGEDLRIENERLNVVLLSSKRERVEVEEGIVQLRLQLMKMIAEHKALKSRYSEADRRLRDLVNTERENRRLRARSVAVNNSLLRKIKEEKKKCKLLEGLLREERDKSIIDFQKEETVSSMTVCLQQALNRERDLRERLKFASKTAEDSVDEGYGDCSGLTDIPLSSPSAVDPVLMNFAVNLLVRSQNFTAPVDTSLRELELKIDRLGEALEPVCVKCR